MSEIKSSPEEAHAEKRRKRKGWKKEVEMWWDRNECETSLIGERCRMEATSRSLRDRSEEEEDDMMGGRGIRWKKKENELDTRSGVNRAGSSR